MNLAEVMLSFLNNPILETVALYVIQSLIGFLFGMSLVYMTRMRGIRQAFVVLPAMLAFYLMVYLLNDYLLALRLIQVFALLHISVVAIVVGRRESTRR